MTKKIKKTSKKKVKASAKTKNTIHISIDNSRHSKARNNNVKSSSTGGGGGSSHAVPHPVYVQSPINNPFFRQEERNAILSKIPYTTPIKTPEPVSNPIPVSNTHAHISPLVSQVMTPIRTSRTPSSSPILASAQTPARTSRTPAPSPLISQIQTPERIQTPSTPVTSTAMVISPQSSNIPQIRTTGNISLVSALKKRISPDTPYSNFQSEFELANLPQNPLKKQATTPNPFRRKTKFEDTDMGSLPDWYENNDTSMTVYDPDRETMNMYETAPKSVKSKRFRRTKQQMREDEANQLYIEHYGEANILPTPSPTTRKNLARKKIPNFDKVKKNRAMPKSNRVEELD